MVDEAAIRERWGKVTPGIWEQEINEQGRCMIAVPDRYIAEVGSRGDWEALTAAPTDIATLLATRDALRPLRAAVRRYGRALARINDTGTQMRAGDDFDAWYAAAKALDARALALAAEEGQG